MAATDTIADMLTRIRNAISTGKREVLIPASNIKHNIAKILESEKWIQKIETVEVAGNKTETKFKYLKLTLRYKKSGKPVINKIERASKPGLRIYVKKEELPKVLNDYGIAIISTPYDVMTNKQAKEKGVGGEVLCKIY
jgi:small subunit ribosomal protein S8